MDTLMRDVKRFDSRVGPIRDWLEDLEKRCIVSKVKEDEEKIIVCGLYIGPAGKNAMRTLPAGTTWADTKKLLIQRLADGTDEKEAWEALKKLSGRDKSLADLGSEVEQLAKRAFPGKESVQERQAIDTFLRAIEEPLAAEIQRMGHSKFEDVLKAARRLEKLTRPTAAGGIEAVMKKLQEMELKFDNSMKEYTSVHLTTSVPNNRPNNQGRRCFWCDQRDHRIYDCPLKQELLQLQSAAPTETTTQPTESSGSLMVVQNDGPWTRSPLGVLGVSAEHRGRCCILVGGSCDGRTERKMCTREEKQGIASHQTKSSMSGLATERELGLGLGALFGEASPPEDGPPIPLVPDQAEYLGCIKGPQIGGESHLH